MTEPAVLGRNGPRVVDITKRAAPWGWLGKHAWVSESVRVRSTVHVRSLWSTEEARRRHLR